MCKIKDDLKVIKYNLALLLALLLLGCGGSTSNSSEKQSSIILIDGGATFNAVLGEHFDNPISVERSGSTYSYSSDNPSIAKISSNGVITLLSHGKTTIRIHIPESDKFLGMKRSFELIIKEKPNFDLKREGVVTAVQNEIFSNPLITPTDGVRYTYNSSNTDLAQIDDTGTLNLKEVGQVVITINSSETERFIASKKSYILDIEKFYFTNERCSSYNYRKAVQLNNSTIQYQLPAFHCVGNKEQELKIKYVEVENKSTDQIIALSNKASFTQSPGSEYFKYAFEVQNLSNAALCFVQLTDIEILDSNGENISTSDHDFTFARGTTYSEFYSFGPNRITTNTCLVAGGTGSIIGIQKNLNFDSINKYVISGISYKAALSEKMTNIEALGYDWNNITGNLHFSFKNTGPSIKTSSADIIYYDEQNKILSWNYAFTDPIPTNIPTAQDFHYKNYLSIINKIRATGFRLVMDYDYSSINPQVKIANTMQPKQFSSNDERDFDHLNNHTESILNKIRLLQEPPQ